MRVNTDVLWKPRCSQAGGGFTGLMNPADTKEGRTLQWQTGFKGHHRTRFLCMLTALKMYREWVVASADESYPIGKAVQRATPHTRL